MTRLRNAFLVLAVAWALAVPAAAYAVSHSASTASSVGQPMALMVYRIGRLICHQRPERSFHLFGAQLPVCARCTGIYAGAALTAIAVGALATRPVRLATARRVLLIAMAPAAATLLYEWTTGQAPTLWTRALSGMPIGAAVGWIVQVVETRQSGPASGAVELNAPPRARGTQNNVLD